MVEGKVISKAGVDVNRLKSFGAATPGCMS